ncbi:MAG: DUF4345 family protein [Pseudomonadota bacterium]
MDVIYLINVLAMLTSVGLGAAGWLAPKWTMDTLDLKSDGSVMGVSEVRAASGALFVGVAVAALIINQPLAYAMVGFVYGGAAIGRLTSLILDQHQGSKARIFFLTEAVIAGLLIVANLPAAI